MELDAQIAALRDKSARAVGEEFNRSYKTSEKLAEKQFEAEKRRSEQLIELKKDNKKL